MVTGVPSQRYRGYRELGSHMQTGQALPAFLLTDGRDGEANFPSGREAIVCFVKDDCPTCHVAMPVLDALHQAVGGRLDFFVAGQTEAGNAALTETFAPGFPILDDSSLKVSFACDIDTVPSLFRVDGDGRVQSLLVGFVREEWQALA